jgi:hypothetical protein
MSHQRTPRLKPLLERVPPGFMVDAAWLKRQGIDPKSIHDYVQRGWLERVVRGVYRRPLAGQAPSASAADWQLPLLSIQWIMGHDVHLGGLSALAWHGLAHYLPLGGEAHVHLYGEVPAWLARLPVTVQFIVRSRALFGDDLSGVENAEHQFDTTPGLDSGGGSTVSPWRWPLKVSSPERAILEALDKLPGHASFHNLDMVFQGLSNLRPRRLMSLLRICRSIKVRRLFFVFADRHEHAWLKHLDKAAIDFGSGPRALVKGGKLHPTYRIYVPEELLPADMTGSTSHA